MHTFLTFFFFQIKRCHWKKKKQTVFVVYSEKDESDLWWLLQGKSSVSVWMTLWYTIFDYIYTKRVWNLNVWSDLWWILQEKSSVSAWLTLWYIIFDKIYTTGTRNLNVGMHRWYQNTSSTESNPICWPQTNSFTGSK